jgi:acyl-ACP thioesterase
MRGSVDPRPNGGDVMVPVPTTGRLYSAGRRVRLGDVDPSGRLRLDAVARYLQDVATDDTDDAGMPASQAWVVRRSVVEQRRPAVLGERLELATFCAGFGSRWAERRVAMSGERGASIDAATVWVHLDPTTGRPKALTSQFHELYAPTAAGREVLARLVHEPVPPGGEGVASFPWTVRAADLDVFDHANNAMAWAVVEQLAQAVGPWGVAGDHSEVLAAPFRAEVEFRNAVERSAMERGVELTVAHRPHDGGHTLTVWSSDGSTAHLTATLAPLDD